MFIKDCLVIVPSSISNCFISVVNHCVKLLFDGVLTFLRTRRYTKKMPAKTIALAPPISKFPSNVFNLDFISAHIYIKRKCNTHLDTLMIERLN